MNLHDFLSYPGLGSYDVQSGVLSLDRHLWKFEQLLSGEFECETFKIVSGNLYLQQRKFFSLKEYYDHCCRGTLTFTATKDIDDGYEIIKENTRVADLTWCNPRILQGQQLATAWREEEDIMWSLLLSDSKTRVENAKILGNFHEKCLVHTGSGMMWINKRSLPQ